MKQATRLRTAIAGVADGAFRTDSAICARALMPALKAAKGVVRVVKRDQRYAGDDHRNDDRKRTERGGQLRLFRQITRKVYDSGLQSPTCLAEN